jgi:Rrf2 family protein
MQLTLATDYAIRTVLYLAQREGIVPTGEISEAMGIPKSYLVKILRDLRNKGYIVTSIGVKGGYELCREADQITVLDIIETIETTVKINRCLEEDAYCSRFATENCPVRKFYTIVQQNMEEQLSAVTIQQLLEPDQEEKREKNK